MAEELLHHVLRDAGVDQACPESVTELVTGHRDRLSRLVAQADDALPAPELLAERAVRVGPWAVVVAGDAGEQPRAPGRPALAHVVLLGPDRRRGFGAERDQLLGPDLDGLEPQARPAAAVGEHRVEREGARIPAAQPGLDHDEDEVAGRRCGICRDGLIGFQLGHHELGDEPGDLVVVEGEFLDVDDGVWQQARAASRGGGRPRRTPGSCDSDSARVAAE